MVEKRRVLCSFWTWAVYKAISVGDFLVVVVVLVLLDLFLWGVVVWNFRTSLLVRSS
jgi:hypothetical protein